MASHSDMDKCATLESSSLPSVPSAASLIADCAYQADMMPAGTVSTVSMALKPTFLCYGSKRRLWVSLVWPAPSEIPRL